MNLIYATAEQRGHKCVYFLIGSSQCLIHFHCLNKTNRNTIIYYSLVQNNLQKV